MNSVLFSQSYRNTCECQVEVCRHVLGLLTVIRFSAAVKDLIFT